MSTRDWEEVKRLAADFQRAQLSSSIQRLSERNCIEIINKLIERQEVQVFFTTDGKEYITPDHLIKEIKDELFVHNGRINLVELAKILLVDFNVISAKTTEIVKNTPSLSLINGQIIDQHYIITLCEEINEKLQQQGQVKLSDLSSSYDLPADFLQHAIEKQLGKIVKAKHDKQDQHVYVTQDFIDRTKSSVRGALHGLTRPVPVSVLLNLCNIQEKTFHSVLEELKEGKLMLGTIAGVQGNCGTYIPAVYSRSQTEWVKKFYAQNGYLEFVALNRLGISDPVHFIKRHFDNANLIILASCAVGPLILDQVEGAIDDVLASGTFIDILSLLPSVFEEKDAEVILRNILKKKSSNSLQIFNSTYVVTDSYLCSLIKVFDSFIETKAQQCVASGDYVKAATNMNKSTRSDGDRHESRGDRKEERRRKAAEGKGGGGTQGRETKTKSTKKKYMKNLKIENNEDDYDDETIKGGKSSTRLEIVSLDEIKGALDDVDTLQEESSEEFIESIATYLHPLLNKNAMAIAKTLYENSIASTHLDRRKKHNELEEKLNDLILKVRLFEKGYKQFPSKDMQQHLAKYLLKTICTDVTNEIIFYVGQDNISMSGKDLTAETRMKVINSLPNDMREILKTLHKSLTASTVEDFLNVIDAAVGPGICDIILKKLDKKRERPELMNHRQLLLEQLNISKDPVSVLLFTCLLVFQAVTQTMLHASGKFISQILAFVQPSIPSDTYDTLQLYHDLAIKLFTSSNEEDIKTANDILEKEMQCIKDIGYTYKKGEKSRMQSE